MIFDELIASDDLWIVLAGVIVFFMVAYIYWFTAGPCGVPLKDMPGWCLMLTGRIAG